MYYLFYFILAFTLIITISQLHVNLAIATTIWNVGDSQGWTTMDYAKWTNGKSFKQGDILYFEYAKGAHDVAEVSETDFHACKGSNPMRRWTDGNNNVTLDHANSQYFFICTFEGHCPPMQLSINAMPSSSTISFPSMMSLKSYLFLLFLYLFLSIH